MGAKWRSLGRAQPGGAGPTGRCRQRPWRPETDASATCPMQQADTGCALDLTRTSGSPDIAGTEELVSD